MLRRRQNRRRAFTLVEIMIVVAIIAMLAAIALPGYLRSRKRSAATVILNDARIIDGAIDQYALENGSPGSAVVTSSRLTGFLKGNTRLYNIAVTGSILTDIFGNSYSYGLFDAGVHVNPTTQASFTDAIDNSTSFWGAYY